MNKKEKLVTLAQMPETLKLIQQYSEQNHWFPLNHFPKSMGCYETWRYLTPAGTVVDILKREHDITASRSS